MARTYLPALLLLSSLLAFSPLAPLLSSFASPIPSPPGGFHSIKTLLDGNERFREFMKHHHPDLLEDLAMKGQAPEVSFGTFLRFSLSLVSGLKKS